MTDTTVLLVDDDRTILKSLREQIRALYGSTLGCETTESVEEAWEVLTELQERDDVKVILIVSDWLMPEVKGDVFLSEVRQRYPKIVRVMLTGQADSSVLERVQAEGLAPKLIFKPWSREDIEHAVGLALNT